VIFTTPLESRDCAAAASEKPVAAASTPFGSSDEILADRRQQVTGLPLLEEVDAERILKRRDSAGDRRLADPQLARGGQRAPVAGHGKEIARSFQSSISRILAP
jgi:hypothetical protein